MLLSASDVEGDVLTFNISGGDQISTTLSGNDLTFTPAQDFNGSESFTVSVSDGNLSNSETFTVTVNAVNDAPVLASVSDVSFDEDGSGSTSLSADDVDGDSLEFSISGGTDITASLSGSDVTFSAPANYNGSEEFSVSVSDGEYSDAQSITVTVNAVNDAPTANATSATTAEDQSVVVTLSGNDIDGDALTYSLDADAENGTVVISGTVATYTPNANYNGDDGFIFSVSDGELSASAIVTLTVNAVNDAPVLASVSDVSFDEDGSGSTSLSASDVDGDSLEFSISGGTDITASLSGSDVTFSAPANYNGSEEFTISVTDGELIDTQTITVTVNAVNDAPIAEDINIEIIEDETIVIQLVGLDVDAGTILTYEIVTSVSNGILNVDGALVTYSPHSNYNGSDSFTYQVTDGFLASDIATVEISIESINDVPVITSVAPTTATEDIEYTYQVVIEDPDNDSFEFILDNAPEGMSATDTGLIVWTPLEGVTTSGLVTLTVSDGELSSQEFFEITVTQVNDAPVITSVASSTATEDIEYAYQVTVTDSDNESFTYELSNQPDGMIITPSGLISWTPLEGVTTSGLVILTVSDGDLVVTEEFEISVTQVNDVPVITSVAPTTATEDIEYTYQVVIEDPDNDSFEFILDNAPEGMSATDTGLIVWDTA